MAEKVEKIADEVGDQLPDGGKLQTTLELIEDLAEETAKNAHLAGDLIDKVNFSPIHLIKNLSLAYKINLA